MMRLLLGLCCYLLSATEFAKVDGAAGPLLNSTAMTRSFRGIADTTKLNKTVDHQRHHHRTLALVNDHNFFTPLDCNTPICGKKKSTWSAENYNPAAGTVVIPCGHCITMDYPGNSVLELPFGLDVQGVLKFPAFTYKFKPLTIVTPFVRVQGKLSIKATRNKVTDNPNVKIILTDGPSTSFVPAGNNKYACSVNDFGTPSPCVVGEKPIVVAGGQLDVQGLPPDCSTWVHLHDILTSDNLPPPSSYTKLPVADPNHPNAICRRNDVPYLQDDFSSLNGAWSGGDSGKFKLTPRGTLFVAQRQDINKDGPAYDLRQVRDCLISGQTYLFSARVRLWHSVAEDGTPTTCAATGRNCLRLGSYVRFDSGALGRVKSSERQSDYMEYGIWQTIHFELTFDSTELASNPIYHQLVLAGAQTGVNIEIDDVSFGLPPKSAVPDPNDVCGGNLIMNGDASASQVDPYPMEVFGEGRISVMGAFFRTDKRTSNADSIANYLDAPGCIVPGAQYKISARIRVRSSNAAVASVITFRTLFTNDGSSIKLIVAECPASQRTWVDCEGIFTVVDDFDVEKVDNIRFAFETIGTSLHSFDVTDWHLEFIKKVSSSIIVREEGVKGCWSKGAEILITSHTIDFESAQLRRLVAQPKAYADGLLQLELDDFIVPSVTEQHGDGFAVEVALLSRNIVFEGAKDNSDSLLGGHLIVLNTPNVKQLLEGTEIRNFGRQGELGRYPVHFHLCGDVRGAQVSKNSIRNSNQRCVVIHGSHNVTVAHNVAYETMGHCYLLEDGGEIDNAFIENLGASTRAAERIVRAGETDGINPSTFWASNPANIWIGNVAAGSESSGFWFELQLEVKSPTSMMRLSNGMVPRRMALVKFVNNTAHSNAKHGLRTYPSGFQPPKQAIFDNTRSYKNIQDGVFFHQSSDLMIKGGSLADNSVQADFDKADNIVVKGVHVTGMTSRYRQIVLTQEGRFGHYDITIGLQLHSFVNDVANNQGATIQNVRFSGFADTLSSRTALIDIDEKKTSGHFDYWTTIEGVRVDEGVAPDAFDFRNAAANGIADIVLTDLDSSMSPAGFAAAGASSVVSNSPLMTTFIDTTNCMDFSSRQGYLYCRRTCLRTISFATNPADTEDLILRMYDKADPNNRQDYPGMYFTETLSIDDDTPDEFRNSWIRKYRIFAAALPNGRYNAEFIDAQTGVSSWPKFVETTLEVTSCPNALDEGAVQLIIPATTQGQCRQLVENGDMESPRYSPWLHHESGIVLENRAGLGGTNAIADTVHDDPTAYIGQFVDTRCLTHGLQYDVRAWVKLINTNTGRVVVCEKGANSCPSVQLRVRDLDNELDQEFATTVASSFVRPLDNNGWNLLQGTVTIDSRIAAADRVAFAIKRGTTNVKMVLDNVSMTLVSKSCSELVWNGKFSDGRSTYWEEDVSHSASSHIEVVDVDTGFALRLRSRSSSSDSIVQNVRTGCISLNERYLATARVRLLHPMSDTLQDCNRGIQNGKNACPRMRLKSFIDVGLVTQDSKSHDGGGIADMDHGITSDGWYTLSGIFWGTDYDENSERSELSIGEGAPSGIDLVFDDVSITPLPMTCSELFMNGDAEDGDTARFWRTAVKFDDATIAVVSLGGNNHALKISNRKSVRDGIQQEIDARCLASGSSWTLTARMKLVATSGGAASCDPTETGRIATSCPPVRIMGSQCGAATTVDERFYLTDVEKWNASTMAWHDYAVKFTVSSDLATCQHVEIGIRSYNLDWDLIVDELSIAPN